MSMNHIIGKFEAQDCRGYHERLITFTLLYYKYQFIGSLHIVDNRSWSWVLVTSCCCGRAFKNITWFNLLFINKILVSLLSIFIPYIILCKNFSLHLLHCTWLGCIKSYTKDLNHRFLVSGWLFHNFFMDLGNPQEIIVHYLLIGGMAGFDHRYEFPMISALMCMVAYGQDL